jgi:F0F1-type ATP synthase delta subunit
MADHNTIARPYAQAVFEIANEAGTLDESPTASCRIHGLADARYGEMIDFRRQSSASH